MDDEAKLKQLNKNFLTDLKTHSIELCLSHKRDFIKCMSESMFNHCGKYMDQFRSCADKAFEELKEENKEILEFKIDSDAS